MKKIALRWPGHKRTTTPVHRPQDGERSGEVEMMSADDVAWVAKTILKGQNLLQSVPPRGRAQWLKAISEKIKADREELSLMIASEGGKPLKDARIEVDRAVQTFNLCAEETLRIGGEMLPLAHTQAGEGKLIFTMREAIGPVFALSAFNHPLNLLAHQIGTALAAGCAVAFKPSINTPYCAEWLADTLLEVGVPLEVAFILHAHIPEIQALVARPEFQFVSFIGSAKIGWDLRSRLAPGTRLALEHGGQAPAIVWDDADLPKAVSTLLKSTFYHAGQVCISTQKIYLHENIREAFTKAFIEGAKKLVVGDACDEKTDIGPLIRPAEKKRLRTWVDEARAAGAKILLEDSEDRGPHHMGPTILADASHEADIWREEAFGPVVCLESFDDIAPIYQELSENPFQFEAAIYTQNYARALDGIKKLAAMTVVVNDHNAWRVDAMPFGGHRQSGLGMGGVKYAIEEQTRLKQIVLNGF